MPSSVTISTLEKFSTFGDLLRFLRRRAGITQMELALAVGYSDAQISRLEQNLRLPDIPTIEARFVPALGLEDEPKVVTRLLDLAANVRREDAPGLGLCPYKGLSYFTEADADLFVGREALTAKLTERVLALAFNATAQETRFLAVVGASGSGKSSLVRAGLVPALRWNKASGDWNIQVFTPTAHPLESLAISLTQENDSLLTSARIMDDLAGDDRSLHLFARRSTRSTNGSRLLLVVDQFEELFALCRAEQERASFINNLLGAASEPDGPIIVVITLRADFYAHCAGHIQLREALALHQEYIGAMNVAELKRAIEEPAQRGRWELEPGLVELLLHEVGYEPGALPLLSHALLETWHRRRGRMMTLSGYTSSGGVRGAIAETAETVFIDQFTPEQKAIARRIFLRLTELGDETAPGHTRRRATFSELILKPEEALNTHNVLKALADARLIITSADSAEVAHEALIREWPTLRGWLEDNREGLHLHRHLTEAAQEWSARNREADMLYRGVRLAQAREWASSHPDEINLLEREFLDVSQALAECEANEREAQRQRELEAAQKLAEAERKRAEEQATAAGQLRIRSLYLAGAFIIAIALAFSAGFLGWQARLASQRATSRELAAAAISNLELDPERSILLALEAIHATYTLEAENALHQSILNSRVRLAFPAHEPGALLSVAYSPDGSQIATASQDQSVKVWDSASGKLLFTMAGHSATYNPDGQRLATVVSDGTVKMWEPTSGQEITLAGHIQAGTGVSFSPDGSFLATVTAGNTPRIWEIASSKELVNFPGHRDYVSSAIFSPDGKQLLTASDDGTARLWDAVSGKELLSLDGHPGWVWNASFSPDGSRIATISQNEARIWDATTGQKLLTLTGHMNTIYTVAFSPDGNRMVTGGLDRKVKVWDSTTGRQLFNLAGHSGAISGAAFSPDGARLATASDDGTVRIWDLSPSQEALTFYALAGLSSPIIFSPDGTRLAGAENQVLKIWDADSGEELLTMTSSNKAITALAYSPDGKLLGTAGDESILELWDAASGEQLYIWSAHTGQINALAFNPDGTQLVSASDDYKIKAWDVTRLREPITTSRLLFTLDLPTEVKSIAFDSKGSSLAAGLQNGAVKIWDMPARTASSTLTGHMGPVVSLAFRPDGESLVTAGQDGRTRVWHIPTEKELFSLSGHTATVTAVAYSPDSKSFATASQDGSTKLWDADTHQELLTFLGDSAQVKSLAFNPDGTRLLTSTDAGVRIYILKIEDLIALGRTRVTRPLTSDECQTYLHAVSETCAQPISIPTATPFPDAVHGRICQVTNTGGLYDNYFNQLIYTGLQESAKLFNWEANALQSVSITDYEKNLQAYLKADCNLIVTPGTLVETTHILAAANPNQRFMVMDFVMDPPLDNLWTQIYATDQAAFLAGYIAASVTKTGRVGTFGGVDIPQVTDFMDGFTLGVSDFNEKNGKSIQVIGWDVVKHEGLFVGGFCCTTEGRQMAQQLLDKGADVLLPVAGQSVGWGAGAAVQEHGNAWFIGVDTDWTVTAPEFADIILTSIEKRFDVSVVQAARSIDAGAFTGGIHLGTLATGEVGISPFHTLDTLVSPQVKADLEQIRADIIAGKIKTRY